MAQFQTDVTRYELRLLVYDCASYFSAVVGGAADTIVEAEEDRDVQKAALRFKIHAIPAMQKAVFQSDPLAGLGHVADGSGTPSRSIIRVSGIL
jgi:hypothetical protein